MTARSWWLLGGAAAFAALIYLGIQAIGLLNMIYTGGIR